MIRIALIGLVIALTTAGWTRPSAAADSPLPEYQVKAAIVYKVAKFVEWPNDAFLTNGSPLIMCISGVDPFGQYIDNLNGQMIQGRPFIIRRAGDDYSQLERCHIVFVGPDPEQDSVMDSIRNSPVLTIGDSSGFAESGGMLGLSVDNHRVAFEINLNAVRDAGLDISASLLQLATIVTSRTD